MTIGDGKGFWNTGFFQALVVVALATFGGVYGYGKLNQAQVYSNTEVSKLENKIDENKKELDDRIVNVSDKHADLALRNAEQDTKIALLENTLNLMKEQNANAFKEQKLLLGQLSVRFLEAQKEVRDDVNSLRQDISRIVPHKGNDN